MKKKGLRTTLQIISLLGLSLSSLATYLFLARDESLIVKSYEIETSKINKGESFKIVSLSDYHNHGIKYKDISLIDVISSECPDAIVMTGDMIDSHTNENDFLELEKLVKGLFTLGKPIFFASGNHEADAPKEIRDRSYSIYKKYNVVSFNLSYPSAEIKKESGAKIKLFGLDDPGLGEKDKTGLLKGSKINEQGEKMILDDDEFNLLLSHRPYFFILAKKLGFDLTISGHTHAGQINLFGYPLLSLPFTKYEQGSYLEEGKRLIISNGLGTSFYVPIRYKSPYSLLSITIKGTK